MEATGNQRREPKAGEVVHSAQDAELETGIVGLFDAPQAANEAFEVLLQLGYHPDEVGILIAESTKERFHQPSLLTHPEAPEEPREAPRGDSSAEGATPPAEDAKPETRAMLQGVGVASAIGALGGLLVAGAAAVALPGLGLVMLGPITGLGAGFGAIVGGVYGVPAMEGERMEHVTRYEAAVRAGKVLIQVIPHDRADESRIKREWNRLQAATA
jgi:hypothetical protein